MVHVVRECAEGYSAADSIDKGILKYILYSILHKVPHNSRTVRQYYYGKAFYYIPTSTYLIILYGSKHSTYCTYSIFLYS